MHIACKSQVRMATDQSLYERIVNDQQANRSVRTLTGQVSSWRYHRLIEHQLHEQIQNLTH